MIKKNKAFTLVEILIVLGIIGILMAMSMAAFMSARGTARDSKRKTDVEQIRGALETYKADNGAYPISGGADVSTALSVLTTPTQYIASLPEDPQSTQNYYYSSTTGSTYKICLSLEKSSGAAVSGCGSCGTKADGSGTAVCNYAVVNP